MPALPEDELVKFKTWIKIVATVLYVLSGTATVGVSSAAVWHTPRVLVLLLLMLALHWPMRLISKPMEEPLFHYPDAEITNKEFEKHWMF